MTGWTVRDVVPAVGAEVGGVDLAALDEAGLAALLDLVDRRGALLLRDQRIGDAELVAFSRRLGTLDLPPVQERGRTAAAGFPEVYVVSNIVDGAGRPIGSLGAGEAVWHTDMSYLETPPDFSLLHAREVPPAGGDTWLCGMAAAWRALPDALKARIAGLRLKHDGTYNSGGYLRAGVAAVDDPVTSPGAVHPLVCAHPRGGPPLLYLGRRRNAWIVGLPLAESEALLDELWAIATRPEHCYAHHWRVGDLLLWDNRATMHRRDAFDPASRRLMHRTQVQGRSAPRALAA
ncbi:MAG: TauD/TfdA family dioxygenase [Dongiaceae bacterium]